MAIDTSIDRIMAFENGDLDRDEIIELFQSLVDSGLAWKLQGSYGRAAKALIDAGLVFLPDHDCKASCTCNVQE